MKATEFYESFERAFIRYALPQGTKRLSGAVSKWIIPSALGRMRVKYATNFKAAGLLPLWPGEFKCDIEWLTGKGASQKTQDVSLFQYTTDTEKSRYTELQHNALRKFALLPTLGNIHIPVEYNGPPRPNIDEWCYYVDVDDAEAWGSWHGSVMAEWVGRFESSPESLEDWCWRVLWPDLPKKSRH